MRVLVLNYEFPPLGGGAAPVSKELAIRMASLGHQIDVVTMGYKGLPEQEIIDGVNIYRVKCLRSKMSSCAPWEQFSYIVSGLRTVEKLLARGSYDLCHAHFIVPTGVLALLVKKKYGLRYILTAHGSDVEGHNTKKGNLLMHKLIRGGWKKVVSNAEKVIAPSNYLLRLIEARYQGPNSIIPNGIDLERYQEMPENGREKSLLFVGRLQVTKNVQLVIKALAKANLPGWRFDIVGDGPYKDELIRLARELGIQDMCRFHGWIKNGSAEHLEFLSKAALFISESYFESFGVSAVEAIASGCPVILSDIEAHRMFTDNENCFTNPDDDDLLAERLVAFAKGEINLHAGRQKIAAYAWEKVAAAYNHEYALLAGEK